MFGRRGQSLIGGSYRRQSADCICQSKTKKFGCEMNLNRPTLRYPPLFRGSALWLKFVFIQKGLVIRVFFEQSWARAPLAGTALFSVLETRLPISCSNSSHQYAYEQTDFDLMASKRVGCGNQQFLDSGRLAHVLRGKSISELHGIHILSPEQFVQV